MATRDAVLLFDGECGFCTGAADWIVRRWPQDDAPAAIAWQHLSAGELRDIGLSSEQLMRAAWWVDGERQESGASAVARALIAAKGAWKFLGCALLVPPISWFAAFGYRIVARYRYRLPGSNPACKV